MKQKLIDLGIWYNIDKAWHKKIKMPKDKNDNELPWFDIDGKSNKQENNSDVMKKILVCIWTVHGWAVLKMLILILDNINH